MAEESSIMMIKLSYVGLMKKINSELSLCKKEEILKQSLIDLLEDKKPSKLRLNLHITIIWDT